MNNDIWFGDNMKDYKINKCLIDIKLVWIHINENITMIKQMNYIYKCNWKRLQNVVYFTCKKELFYILYGGKNCERI